jgi:ATP-dependent RNA helicase RhlE
MAVRGFAVDALHGDMRQTLRQKVLRNFRNGQLRALIATDVAARGIDVAGLSHVINFDAPRYPEQYIHRIGRTGRARKSGEAIFLFIPSEEEALLEIEILMQTEIPIASLPEEVEISNILMPEEKDRSSEKEIGDQLKNIEKPGLAFHEKSKKNKKVNLGGSYKREIKKKYKKPKTRPPKTKGKK